MKIKKMCFLSRTFLLWFSVRSLVSVYDLFSSRCRLSSSSSVFPHTGLLPFRPASNSCSSSAASPAPSSGGFRQHRTSCPPKRPTSTPRACRGEFSSLRLINLVVNDSYNVNHGKKIYPCYLKWLLKMLYDFRTCCTTGSRRDPEFKS